MAIFFLVAVDSSGNQWQVFPELQGTRWIYSVPADSGYVTVGGVAVQPGQTVSGNIGGN